ncbi:MAG: hypothetical protein GY862_05500, partial [Gammaproteobacteria bacterium]|nr:hypothetical protein [Gammaproteobacteria bacterium]
MMAGEFREPAGELDWQRRREEMEKARLSARQAAQQNLSLAELLDHKRVALLGDPGSGKTTITRYLAYALAAGDHAHTGKHGCEQVPVLVRIASYAKVYEQDNLHLVEYIERL